MEPRKRYKADLLEYDFLTGIPYGDDEVCLSMTKREALAIMSYIDSMAWPTRWYSKTGQQIEKSFTEEFHAGIVDKLMRQYDCRPEIPEGENCFAIGPFDASVSYYPNHPIFDPSPLAPFTYNIWTTGAGYIQADASDAMIAPGNSLLEISNILTGFIPSVTLRFSGTGTVRLKFKMQPQGGIAFYYPDNNPFFWDIDSLSAIQIQDIVSIQALLDLLEVVVQGDSGIWDTSGEIEFATPGDHEIKILFWPTVNVSDPTESGIGGGFAGAEFCGDFELIGEVPDNLITDIRLNGAIIEKYFVSGGVGSWVPAQQTLGGNADVYERFHNANNLRVGNDVTNPSIDTRFYGSGTIYEQVFDSAGTRRLRLALQNTKFQHIGYSRGFSWQHDAGIIFELTTNKRAILASDTVPSGGGGWSPLGTLHVFSQSGTDVPLIVEARNLASDVQLWQRNAKEVAGLGVGGVLRIGPRTEFYQDSSTGARRFTGAIQANFWDDTDATRKSEMALVVSDHTSAGYQGLVIKKVFDGIQLGLFGYGPAYQPILNLFESEWNLLPTGLQSFYQNGAAVGYWELNINPDLVCDIDPPTGGNAWALEYQDTASGNGILLSDWHVDFGVTLSNGIMRSVFTGTVNRLTFDLFFGNYNVSRIEVLVALPSGSNPPVDAVMTGSLSGSDSGGADQPVYGFLVTGTATDWNSCHVELEIDSTSEYEFEVISIRIEGPSVLDAPDFETIGSGYCIT